MKITEFLKLLTPAANDVIVGVDVSEDITKKIELQDLPVSNATQTSLNLKQNTLVSGTNIKTLNSESLLGSGNIEIITSPSGGAGAIQFSDGSAFASDSNLFWDNTNKRLGVGTNTPSTALEVKTANTGDVDFVNFTNGNGINTARFKANGGFIFGSSDFTSIPGIATTTRHSASIGFLSAPSARLQVRGSGSTSATTSLLVQNSSGTELLKVTDNGVVNVGILTGTGQLRFLQYLVNGSPFNFNTPNVFSVQGGSAVATSGIRDAFLGNLSFAQSSGTAMLNIFNASPTINQTGGASGITRGLYVNPTLTSAADFRAIETTAGNVVFGNLPTSSAGLPSGAIWNDGGTLKIA